MWKIRPYPSSMYTAAPPPQTIGKGEAEHSLSCAATSRKIPPLKGTTITKQRFYVNAILLQTVVSGHLP